MVKRKGRKCTKANMKAASRLCKGKSRAAFQACRRRRLSACKSRA